MYPQTNFLVPFVLAELLVKFGLLNHNLALLAGIVGVFIDIDHYLHRIIIHRDFNLKSAWNKAITQHDIHGERTFIHHRSGLAIVTGLLLLLVFINWNLSLVLFFAYYSHLLLDNLHLRIKKRWKFKEGGLGFRIPFYEIGVDLVLIIFSLLLLNS